MMMVVDMEILFFILLYCMDVAFILYVDVRIGCIL